MQISKFFLKSYFRNVDVDVYCMVTLVTTDVIKLSYGYSVYVIGYSHIKKNSIHYSLTHCCA